MMAILIEHYQGKWPFWLSPRQALVMSVGEEFNNYAVEVANFLSTNGSFSGEIITGLPDRSTSEYYFIDTDISERTLKKKVHEAQSRAYNFMIIVGKEEYTSKTVSIRARGMGNSEVKKLSLIDALSYFKEQFNKKA
jgi:threonyl-tRNA synthetase